MASGEIKYCDVRGYPLIMTFPLAASQVFKNASGHFVGLVAGYATIITGATGGIVVGWAFMSERTTSSSAGAEKVGVDVSLTSLYEIPLDTTYTEAQLIAKLGLTCDLTVSSTIQVASAGASTYDGIRIMGYDVDKQTVLVMINPTQTLTGVI